MAQLRVHMTLFAGGSNVLKAARKTPENAPRSGTPQTAVNENAIGLVRHAIADDPHISIQEITELGMKTVCLK